MKTIVSIQYLRAIAALAIVVLHLKGRMIRLGYSGAWPEWLQSGVDLFFVISGFIMVVTTASSSKTAGQFFVNRVERIVPIYWIWTTVVVLLAGAFTAHGLASYFFIPWMHPTEQEFWPILIPGWTLNYEMFFYAIFALCMLFPKRNLILCMMVLMLVAASNPLWDGGILKFYSDPIILEFLLGMLIGIAWVKDRLKSHWSLMALGAILIPLLSGLELHRAISWGFPSALIVIGALGAERHIKTIKFPALLGDASYSLYLTHGLALNATFILATKLGLSWQAYIPFALISSTALGLLGYLYLEVPIANFLKARRRARSSSP